MTTDAIAGARAGRAEQERGMARCGIFIAAALNVPAMVYAVFSIE
jgi:hypothetical protein